MAPIPELTASASLSLYAPRRVRCLDRRPSPYSSGEEVPEELRRGPEMTLDTGNWGAQRAFDLAGARESSSVS